MSDVSVDVVMEFPALLEALNLKGFEAFWIQTAKQQYGASAAYIKKLGGQWRCVAEFASDDYEHRYGFVKFWEQRLGRKLDGIKVKKATGGNA